MAYSDEHEPPELISELVASITAMVDEIVVGFEDAIGDATLASVRAQRRHSFRQEPKRRTEMLALRPCGVYSENSLPGCLILDG